MLNDDGQGGSPEIGTDARLRRYGIAGWPASDLAPPRIWTGRKNERGELVLNSASWGYRDDFDRLVQIMVVRPNGESLDEFRSRAQRNLLYPYVRTVIAPAAGETQSEAERVQAEIARGGRPWTRTKFLVDGERIDFDLLDYGSSFWVAVGPLPDATISISSSGVSHHNVTLIRLPDYPSPRPRVEE